MLFSILNVLWLDYGEIDRYEYVISFIRSNEKIVGPKRVDDHLADCVSFGPLIFYPLLAGDTDLTLGIIQKTK